MALKAGIPIFLLAYHRHIFRGLGKTSLFFPKPAVPPNTLYKKLLASLDTATNEAEGFSEGPFVAATTDMGMLETEKMRNTFSLSVELSLS